MMTRIWMGRLILGLGVAISVGCRSPADVSASTANTQTTIELTDWKTAPDVSDYQEPKPDQYLAAPDQINTGPQSSTETPATKSSGSSLADLPQTDEARQFLGALGVVLASLTLGFFWLRRRTRE
ncbi:LPXTG cell wall anchor domain-containing protein [Lactiplantibacillus mudanjiangensis]|nr:LPXTG cell wall anchor domain-containing protein [Lactiplantibacillus mudanjiangensis]